MNSSRYSRQILFAPIGREGQARIRNARVAVIGCGALGSAHAEALTRAGVGALRLVDRDYVEMSNLQRQSLFDEEDAAQNLPKAVAAERKLKRINSEVQVEGIVADAAGANIEELLRGFDAILDGTDNFETRHILNDAALKLEIPWIYGAVVGSSTVTMTILPGRTACLACVLPQVPQGAQETCDTAGVIGPAVAWASAVQVTEALKILVGREKELHGSLLAFDIWTNRMQRIRPVKDPACRTCGHRDFRYLRDGASFHTVLCGRDAVQIRPSESRVLELAALARRLQKLGDVRSNEYLVRFFPAGYEITVFADGRAIIKGTEDTARARSLYAKYIGT
jgi:molybdopterin-synthase adenylyltransferase